MDFNTLLNGSPVWLQDALLLATIISCGFNVLCAHERWRALRMENHTLATRIQSREDKLKRLRRSRPQQQRRSY